MNGGTGSPLRSNVPVVVEPVKVHCEGIAAFEVHQSLQLVLLVLIFSVEPRPGLPALHDLEQFQLIVGLEDEFLDQTG